MDVPPPGWSQYAIAKKCRYSCPLLLSSESKTLPAPQSFPRTGKTMCAGFPGLTPKAVRAALDAAPASP